MKKATSLREPGGNDAARNQSEINGGQSKRNARKEQRGTQSLFESNRSNFVENGVVIKHKLESKRKRLF